MSKLLELGFSAGEAATIDTLLKSIKSANKLDLSQVDGALMVFDKLANALTSSCKAGEYDLGSMARIAQFCETHLALPVKRCKRSENWAPTCLMAYLDGHWYNYRDIILGRTNWELTEEGKIVKKGYLYGDRNILCYTTNPLQYLKFHCMPDEKVSYIDKQVSGINKAFDDAEYNGVAPVILGIELEVEKKAGTSTRIEHMVAEDLGMDYMILKSDSSLHNGFEIVTCPATLKYHTTKWDKFFENSAKQLQSWTAKSCGMHVHISRKCLTPMHIGKMFTFYNNYENRDFITSIAGRQSHYSKFVDDNSFQVKTKLVSQITELMARLRKERNKKKIDEIEAEIGACRALIAKGQRLMDASMITKDITGGRQRDGNERHTAVNLCKNGTVEIRIFRGNVSKIGMLKNLEFVHAVVEFTREATFRTKPLNDAEKEERKLKRKENTDYALHHTYFIDWLSKDETGSYSNLKLWLQEHKITDKFTKKKLSSKAPANKQHSSEDIRAVA